MALSREDSSSSSPRHCERGFLLSGANDVKEHVTPSLESELQECRDKLGLAEEKVKQLTKENAHLQKLVRELDMERTTGPSSIVILGRKLAKSALDDFKRSAAMKDLVMDLDAVRECQRKLRESGRVSEDIVQLIDPQDDESEEEDEDKEFENKDNDDDDD